LCNYITFCCIFASEFYDRISLQKYNKNQYKLKMEKSPRKVWTKKGTGLMLARRFNVSPRWVSKVLNGGGDSQTARNIRAIAIKEYGGIAIG